MRVSKIEKFLTDDDLKNICKGIGWFLDSDISSYDSLVQGLIDFKKRDRSEFLKCIKASSKHFHITSFPGNDQILSLSKKFNIRVPAQFSRPVIHISSADLYDDPSESNVLVHQDYTSCRGSINSLVVWIPLGGIHGSVGNLHFYDGEPKTLYQSVAGKSVSGTSIRSLEGINRFWVDCTPGDALVFDQFLPHESSCSPGTRISISFRIDDLSCENWKSRAYEYAQRVVIDRMSVSETMKI
jgi:hypothetical protein